MNRALRAYETLTGAVIAGIAVGWLVATWWIPEETDQWTPLP